MVEDADAPLPEEEEEKVLQLFKIQLRKCSTSNVDNDQLYEFIFSQIELSQKT